MRINSLLLTLLLLTVTVASEAQMGINQATPDASAILDVVSTAKGMLIPRMTTAQRNAINTGTIAQGNLVYNTDTEAFEIYNGAAWISVGNEGTNNTYVGETAGDAITTGQDNVFMGFAAGSANSDGSANVFVGSGAGDINAGGDNNVIIGKSAGGLATDPDFDVIIGSTAGSALTTGTGSVAIGYDAMNKVTTGGDNVCIGYIAGQDLTANAAVLVGAYSGSEMTSGASNVALGYSTQRQNQTGASNVAIGYKAGSGSAGVSNYTQNTMIGYRSGEAMTTSGANNVFTGYKSGLVNTDGINNVLLGSDAGLTMTSDDNNVYIGYKAGAISNGASDNVYIGSEAGENATTANSNVAVGYQAYSGTGTAPTGTGNVMAGKLAGYSSTTGNYNTFIGANAGYANTTGSNHVAFGYNALKADNTGGDCTAIGFEALLLATGSDNTAIGKSAGDNITTGTFNITIGANVDAVSATASNQLNIGNSIYADLSTDFVGISNTAPFCPLDIAGVTGSTVARFGDVNGVYIGRDWPGVQFNVYYDGTNNVYGHGSATEYGAAIFMDPSTGEVQHAISSTTGNAGGTATLVTHMTMETSGETGFGTANPTSRIHAIGLASSPAATFNRTTTTGTIVSLHYNGAEQGTIAVDGDGTTISFNAFTGAHYGLSASKITSGLLVKSTGLNQRFHNQENGEIIYGVTTSTVENDSTILGVIDGKLDGSQTPSVDNPSTISAVGNGKMWVAQTSRNVQVGDYLVSSDVPGHVQLDSDMYARSFIVARAVEPINWATVQTEINGQKVAQTSVYFQNFTIDRRNEHHLQSSIDALTRDVELLENLMLDRASK